MPTSLLNRVRGAASIHFIGQDFWTEDIAQLDTDLRLFDVKSNALGPISKRQGANLGTIGFTPLSTWTLARLAVLMPSRYLNPRIGDFDTPTREATSVDHTAGTWDIPDHGFLTATGVRVGAGAGGTLPAGLAANTTYYINAPDGDTVKFYDTEAHAIAGGSPGLVAMTDNGSGELFMIMNTPLIITATDGAQVTFWNSAINELSPLSLGPGNVPLKAMKFAAYTRHGMNWSDANSLYTLGRGTITAAPPDQSQIPTVPYTVDWGAITGLDPRESIDVSFKMTWDEVPSQSASVACRSIKQADAQVDFVPTNASLATLLNGLALQGGTAAPGQATATADMNIYGPGNTPYLRVYGAAQGNAPGRFGSGADRIDKVSFYNVRTAAGGAQNPVAYVGTAAPGA